MKIGPINTTKEKSARRLRRTGRKKKRLKYIAVLPSFITLMNGVCGFFAIIIASQSQFIRLNLSFIRNSSFSPFATAGMMIFLAMVADMLDGRVARLTRTTSSFGGQLDSLSDAVSFGIAPAFLMIKLIEYQLGSFRAESRQFSLFMGRIIFISAILYAMCALVRLARFNVENEEDESAHMSFSGLPSPAAAGVVASLVVLQQRIIHRLPAEAETAFHNYAFLTVIVLPAITLFAGILMVTRIRYPHVANQIFRRKKTLPVFLAIFAAALFILWNIQLALSIGFCGFALYGVARWVIVKTFRKKHPKAEPLPGAESRDSPST